MKKKQNSIFVLRNTAACLLSIALKQRFPSAYLLSPKVTPLGFYCDFALSTAFDQENLKQVEEVMQAWIRQKIGVNMREMVARSAKEYFLFHKEPLLAKHIENSLEQTFFLMQIAGQMVLSESDNALSDLGEIGAFCLQKSERVGSKLRVYGSAFFDKKEMKGFLKKAKEWAFSSHTVLGEKLGLFEDGGVDRWIWFPKGQKALSLLKKYIEKEEELHGFHRVSSMPVCEDLSWNGFSDLHKRIFQKQSAKQTLKMSECAIFRSAEDKDLSSGLLDLHVFQGIRFHVFCPQKDLLDEVISSLHFMTKIFKILGFAFRPVLFEVRKGRFGDVSSLFFKALRSFGEGHELDLALDGIPRIEWSVTDGLGRAWPIAYMSAALPLKGDFASFAGSCCLSFERVFALLLEKEGGYPPFLLSVSQLKVVPLQERHRAFAEETLASLRNEGFRAELSLEGNELKIILRQALEERVPYVLIIGDKELETNTVALRDVRAKQTRSLARQELIELLRLSKLNGSNSSEL